MNIGQLKKRIADLPDGTPCAYSLFLPHDAQARAAGVFGYLSDEDVAATLKNLQDAQEAGIGISFELMDACFPEHLE